MSTPMTVAGLADRYVDTVAALDPVAATFEGVPGHETELTDYSPDGIAARITHDRATRAELATAHPQTDAERIGAVALERHLDTALDLADADEDLRPLRVIASPVTSIVMCFDLMERATAADWAQIAARVGAVPAALDGLVASLREGMRRGVTAAGRQAFACARQAETFAGSTPGTIPYFAGLVEEMAGAGVDEPALRSDLEQAAARATDAYVALGRFLVDEYLPGTDAPDGVGPERYRRWARAFTGTVLDLEETYEWGWEELYRIEAAMAAVGERIVPGEPVGAVIEHLELDSSRTVEGEDALLGWLQDLIDRTTDALDGVHFDIPPEIRRCEAMIAPPGGAAAMYYTGPSEDLSRPGRTWYPTLGRTTFPLWGEVSICYHEAVPGHHLQVATVRTQRDRLNRFQRTIGWNSGHGEGWALYAERLMGELGFLEDPAYELGMLRAQAMRAVRVVVDIGLHLSLPIPHSEPEHGGETWTPELALPFVIGRSHFPEDFMASEVDRYLGLPGQAISYKVGERVWLRARDAARARVGDSFDLKSFHRRALELGSMGLDQLEDELARI
ncbi:MAG TPA: DUF885 domain-containing protein [Acidimicrobiia bacterium]|nr:DUF885 domain-containing protein [Acidimicrobiia bacterium]